MARYVCTWRVKIGDRPPSRETVTVLLGERLHNAHRGFNSLPGVPDVWVEEFEVDAPDIAAAREVAEKFGSAIRAALAHYDGGGLTVGDLDEVRPATTVET